MRALLWLHRWCGILLCLLVVAWCLSGIVMMYVPYPSHRDTERIAALTPISMAGCCRLEPLRADLAELPIGDFKIEMLSGRPVLRLDDGDNASTIDLQSGRWLGRIDEPQARRIAAEYLRNTGISGAPRLLGAIEADQWTVSGFQADRPLWHFALDDVRGTEIYVSGSSGEVVQRTDARQRFWNYFGAVTHWLYPTWLRQHAAAWSQLVIWTSVVGCFLVLTGLYIGWVHWRPGRGRASPYRGMSFWHHYAGLIFGVLVLAWVGSGLVSMNPWGFLAGGSSEAERRQLARYELKGTDALQIIHLLQAQGATAAVRQYRSAAFDGALFLMAHNGVSERRLDARFEPATIDADALRRAAQRLQAGVPLRSAGLLPEGDRYYYAHHDVPPLPVYRVTLADADATRYYIDPVDGSLLRKIDRDGQWWRWLFSAPHQWDFARWLRARPVWDVIVLTLLSGMTVFALTGVWLAVRYLSRRRV